MVCISFSNFVVNINGSPSNLFKMLRGIRQGCPLSPILLLLVVECLSRLIYKNVCDGNLHGTKIDRCLNLIQLLFVDDILMFGKGILE